MGGVRWQRFDFPSIHLGTQVKVCVLPDIHLTSIGWMLGKSLTKVG